MYNVDIYNTNLPHYWGLKEGDFNFCHEVFNFIGLGHNTVLVVYIKEGLYIHSKELSLFFLQFQDCRFKIATTLEAASNVT